MISRLIFLLNLSIIKILKSSNALAANTDIENIKKWHHESCSNRRNRHDRLLFAL